MDKNIESNKSTSLLTIIYVLIIFPLLGENIISTVCGDTISKILSIVSCFSILIIVIKKKKIHIDKFLIVMLILILQHVIIYFLLAPSSIKITTANSIITPYGLMGYFMLFLLISLYLKDINMMKIIFKSMMIIMTISVFLNLIFTGDLKIANNVAVFKEAISTGYTNSRTWLFGHRNMIFIHHLMWILVSYIYYKLSKRNYSRMYIFQMSFTMLVGAISWNSTMMLTTAIIFILGLLSNNIFSKLNINHYVYSYLILEIGIVFFRVQEIFAFIIVNILNRNLSFTGRTYIWNYYISQFKSEGIINKLLGNFGVTELTVNTHNMFLGLLAFTGIIGLVLYFTLVHFSSRELKKEKKADTSKFISIIIFGFLINSLTMEFYLQPLLAMYIGYNVKKFNLLMEEDSSD